MNLDRLAATLRSTDGIRIESVDLGEGADISLYLAMYSNGQRVPLPFLDIEENGTLLLWRSHAPGDLEYGERDRLYLLLDAVCRFLNTGGSAAEMRHWLDLIGRGVGHQTRFLPERLELIASAWAEPGVAEHLYKDPQSARALRWVEGRVVEVTSVISRQQLRERDSV